MKSKIFYDVQSLSRELVSQNKQIRNILSYFMASSVPVINSMTSAAMDQEKDHSKGCNEFHHYILSPKYKTSAAVDQEKDHSAGCNEFYHHILSPKYTKKKQKSKSLQTKNAKEVLTNKNSSLRKSFAKPKQKYITPNSFLHKNGSMNSLISTKRLDPSFSKRNCELLCNDSTMHRKRVKSPVCSQNNNRSSFDLTLQVYAGKNPARNSVRLRL